MNIDANQIIEKLLDNIKQLTLNNIIKDIQIDKLQMEIADIKKSEIRPEVVKAEQDINK